MIGSLAGVIQVQIFIHLLILLYDNELETAHSLYCSRGLFIRFIDILLTIGALDTTRSITEQGNLEGKKELAKREINEL